jgi:hypothetical protein
MGMHAKFVLIHNTRFYENETTLVVSKVKFLLNLFSFIYIQLSLQQKLIKLT